jgi:hypothetical protein
VNQAFRKHLTDAEVELIEATKPANLRDLGEDELGDLHDRVRRASRKYRKLHRRQASAQVSADGGRGSASVKNQRTAVKAEVFEDALARVSRALGKAAKDSAAELKAARLAASRGTSSGPGTRPDTGTAARSGASAGRTPARRKTAVSRKKTASTRATGARRQARRDARP